ncbi:hypothetical protein ARAM_005560 [Aspergillus rambellii]|uniref:Chromosome segregation protein n=1 Tax=Aspergillus rambellii TaxID=308745 RepID=A0A0F8VTJ6_9EURO|nr:hypothetical protein ARAM_005560 [Aspergillus rambellii]
MAHQMETFAARLATFDLVLHPETRRTSTSKSAKPISWPHSRPSPAELAHAGFFYNPYETNPDNTTCFLCRRALDGWEEDDNPITEHLKHSKDCGWAVMTDIQQHSSNPAEIEDPTSERITQARQATFGDSWPHDGKRGWKCQSEKMVEGGWYFCPNEESIDLASCAYCKLSLDGWEPKDDPFDEHYRRSSDCSFFVFAKPPATKGKASRAKKGRPSKASSRLSTQSTVSDILASDVEDTMDQSVLSQSTKAKSTKKSSKSKSKATKSKKDDVQETATQMDVDEAVSAQPEPSKPKRNTRGRKRSSAELDTDVRSIADGEITDQPEPPTKKRATKSRTSTQQEQSVVIGDESEAPEEEDQKSNRGTKKKISRSRKASTASVTSKATSTSRVPRDSELDAEIEAGLDTDEPDARDNEEMGLENTASKPASKKSKSKKKATKKEKAPLDDVERPKEHIGPDTDRQMLDVGEVSAEQKTKSTKGKSKRGSSGNTNDEPASQDASKIDARSEVQATNDDDDGEHHASFLSVEIPSQLPEHCSDAEHSDRDAKKKSKKKTSSDKTKKSKQAGKRSLEAPVEPQNAQEEPSQAFYLDTPKQETREPSSDQSFSHRRLSKVPPKTAERYSDIPQEKQYAKSIAESRNPDLDTRSPEATRSEKQAQEDDPVSPLPSPFHGSPSLSPQSSDAENQPPSLKPSSQRAQMSSPSKRAPVRIPLAASTPSPSKRNVPSGRLQTSHPWVPIDFDEILLASASDKENANLHGALNNIKGELTSPEKKMTVEEWIMWNAKNGEERLKRECERLVGQFEREGARAIRTIEGIECFD